MQKAEVGERNTKSTKSTEGRPNPESKIQNPKSKIRSAVGCKLLAVSLLVFSAAHAQRIIRAEPRVVTSFGVRLVYDDNPFRYSSEDIDSFVARVNPAKFPIRSADDLDLNLSAELGMRYALSGRPGRVGLDMRLHAYASNWEKSYGLARLDLRQNLWTGGEVSAGALTMPGYLVRYYRNPSGTNYIACRFAEYLARAGLAQKVGGFAFRPEYGYEVDDYIRQFDCYDTKAHRLGGEVSFSPGPALVVAAEYAFKTAKAAGPVPDISYDQHGISGRVRTSPSGMRDFSLEGGYGVEYRTYTTANPPSVDPSHAGRFDRIENMNVGASYRLGQVRLELAYEREWRYVASPYEQEIEDVKRYQENRLGFGVRYDGSRSVR